MLEINLLPKELQRRRFGFKPDKKLINVIAGGVAIALVLFLYSYFFQITALNNLQDEITEYERQRAEYMKEIRKIEDIELKKTQILARQNAIMTLDTNRDYWVKLLEDLVRRVPEYVWITTFDQATAVAAPAAPPPGQPNTPRATAGSAKTKINGYSFSLNSLATFLIRLKKSETFNDIEITSIKLQETDKAKAYSFELTCNLVSPGLKVATTETAPQTATAGTQF
jgi:Tfp pilus assembly protein PilN